MAVGDFNGDGKPDLKVSYNCGADVVCARATVWSRFCWGVEVSGRAVTYGTGQAYAGVFRAADVNHDGKQDIVV